MGNDLSDLLVWPRPATSQTKPVFLNIDISISETLIGAMPRPPDFNTGCLLTFKDANIESQFRSRVEAARPYRIDLVLFAVHTMMTFDGIKYVLRGAASTLGVRSRCHYYYCSYITVPILNL